MILTLVASSVYGVAQSGAWFTDQEQVLGNSIDTGTIDIAVDETTTEPFILSDLKPSQHSYHEFIINNVGSNPANIYKLLEFHDCENNPMSEPECEAEGGTWVDYGDHCSGGVETCNLEDVTNYDLQIWVYESDPNDVAFHQTIYADYNDPERFTVSGAYAGDRVLLGMVPAGWHMKVEQSYHMPGTVGNAYQGDSVVYDMTLEAEQLMGTVVLEDKEENQPESQSWWIQNNSDARGTLTYPVRDKTFDFTFTGVAPLANTVYYLIADAEYGVDVITLGSDTSDGNGNVLIEEDLDIGKDLINAKTWLVTDADYDQAAQRMQGAWHPENYLFETSLMDYYDADII